MPSVAEQVEAKLSYGLTDWVVTQREQREALALLRNDVRLPTTLAELEKRGSLGTLIKRVDDTELRRSLLDLLAIRADAGNATAVREELYELDVDVANGGGGAVATTISDQLWQVRFHLIRLGGPAQGKPFDDAPYRRLISRDPGAPFTGHGATGIRPDSRSVPLNDQWKLLNKDQATTARYSNPIPGSLPQYLSSLGEKDRREQAELMLKRPITTVMPDVWGPTPPQRSDLIAVAAKQYGHEPVLVAAFLLAEQRDQSGLEDAKDYASATSIALHNASLGLGQVVVSTATRHSLLSDLISDATMKHSSHAKTARLLTDDVLNIFASAKYLRIVADAGAKIDLTKLPATKAKYPGIVLSAYSRRFAALPRDNIRALGSEYTSRAWDDNLSPGWDDFVYEAYLDVKKARTFT